jgi:hypothetical protein
VFAFVAASVTVVPKQSQLFQPIGGVGALVQNGCETGAAKSAAGMASSAATQTAFNGMA